jgi:hypothetical protein
MRRPALLLLLAAALPTTAAAQPASAPPPAPPPTPAPAPAPDPTPAADPAPAPAPDPAPAPAPRTNVLDSQPAVSGYETSGVSFSGSARLNASNVILMDRGYELGADLTYLTADGGLGDQAIDFTDVILLSLHGRKAFAGKVEVYGGADFLPKQPSFTDELAWQGASAGARLGLIHWLVGEARVAGGPLLDDAGFWGSGAVGVTARKISDETLAFQTSLGVGYTPFFFDADGHGSFWLAELQSRSDIQLHAPNGMAGLWIGFGFAFPIASDGTLPGLGDFDPQTRGDFHLGGVYAVVRDLDLYAEYSFLDRGDLVDPRTLVPVLEGGFDQQQLTIGVTLRFDTEQGEERAALAW